MEIPKEHADYEPEDLSAPVMPMPMPPVPSPPSPPLPPPVVVPDVPAIEGLRDKALRRASELSLEEDPQGSLRFYHRSTASASSSSSPVARRVFVGFLKLIGDQWKATCKMSHNHCTCHLNHRGKFPPEVAVCDLLAWLAAGASANEQEHWHASLKLRSEKYGMRVKR